MNRLCRIGTLIRRPSLEKVARLSSTSAGIARSQYFSTEDDEVEEGRSAVYQRALKSQRPTTIKCLRKLVNSVSLIGHVKYPLQRINSSSFGVLTVLDVRTPDDSTQPPLGITLKMWYDIAKMCFQHVKQGDFIHVSGRLNSRTMDDRNGNRRYFYQVVVNELNYVAKPYKAVPHPESRESQSETGESGLERCDTHLRLWQLFFDSPHEWWDRRKSKKNIWMPDFRHKHTGESLWLSPNDPPWVREKLQRLDSLSKTDFGVMETSNSRLYLWQVFFCNPNEWWDNRNKKRSIRSPDFRHKDTGECLWLNPDDPPWVRKQLELLDSAMAGDAGSRVSQWVYDD